MTEIKIGTKVRCIDTDRQGWQTIKEGVVIQIVDEFVVAKVTFARLQHKDHPERGRDLPASGELAFTQEECDVVEEHERT